MFIHGEGNGHSSIKYSLSVLTASSNGEFLRQRTFPIHNSSTELVDCAYCLRSPLQMCQVLAKYLSCTHTERYRLVHARPRRFSSSCKGNNYQIIAYRPIYTPLRGHAYFRQRHNTILAVHVPYMDEVTLKLNAKGGPTAASRRP